MTTKYEATAIDATQVARYLPSIPEALGLTASTTYLGIVAYTCNPSVCNVKAGGLGVQGHPQLGSEFQASMGDVRPSS